MNVVGDSEMVRSMINVRTLTTLWTLQKVSAVKERKPNPARGLRSPPQRTRREIQALALTHLPP